MNRNCYIVAFSFSQLEAAVIQLEIWQLNVRHGLTAVVEDLEHLRRMFLRYEVAMASVRALHTGSASCSRSFEVRQASNGVDSCADDCAVVPRWTWSNMLSVLFNWVVDYFLQ